MKFIQSVNEKNVLVNLELIVSIEKVRDGIFLCAPNENIFWDADENQLKQDWENIIFSIGQDVVSTAGKMISIKKM